MPSPSTSSTEPPAPQADRPAADRPVFGRPSDAAGAEPALAGSGHSAVASWRADGASSDWCSLRAATVAGVRHRLAGQPGEDSYAWAHDDTRLAVAIGDGVGSVPGSGGAAARACVAAVQEALERSADSPAEGVGASVEAANRAAGGGGATTLVVLVLGRDGRADLARVGDSSAWSIAPGGEAFELFEPPDPERADTVTTALPATSLTPEFRSVECEEGSLLVLVTDGVADPWRDGPTTVAPALTAALLDRPDPVDLLRLVDFSRQGCHDDRTVVCVRVGGAA